MITLRRKWLWGPRLRWHCEETLNVHDLIKRVFRGRKIKLKFAPHRADTDLGGVFSVSLILQEDSRRAVTTEGRSIRLWELNDSESQLLASVEAKHPIRFVASDCCSDEWVAFSSTGTSLSSPCFLDTDAGRR